jgi:hypothetical protein
MPKKKKNVNTLPQQLDDFKRHNPKVAEAMELFGISMAKYRETLNALHSPQIYQSTSTASVEKPKQ